LLNDDELSPFEYVLDNKVVEELQCLEETCSINDGSIVMLELGLLLKPDYYYDLPHLLLVGLS